MQKLIRVIFFVLQVVSTLAFNQPHPFTSSKPVGINGICKRNIRGGALDMVPEVTATIASPTVKALVLSNILPTCIGFYKVEYGVSYAYGTATATSAYLALQGILTAGTAPFATIAKLHAAAIIFYGIRLNLFLGWREFCNGRFRRMRERIEEKRTAKEGATGFVGKLFKRTPFILSCSLLYAGLASPAISSAKLIEMASLPSCPYANLAYKALVGMTWFGFILAAIGDFQKSASKAKYGPDHLVTSGVYSLFRHPNYTGECIGWGSSFLASVVAVIGTKSLDVAKSTAPYLALSSTGLFGILFVLMMATAGLEKKQEEKYGKSQEYKDWIASSWAGPTMKK